MNILDEKTYIEKFPVTNDIVLGIIKDVGVDISRYYFSSMSIWSADDKEYHDVYYGSLANDDITMMICISMKHDTIQLEQFCISLD